MTMYYFQDAKVQSIFQIRMDFFATNIDYFATIEIPTLSLLLEVAAEVESILKAEFKGDFLDRLMGEV